MLFRSHKFQEIVKQINLYGNHFTSTFLGGQQPAYPGYSAAVAAVMLAAIEAARRIANKDFLFISFSSFFCISG